MNASIALVFAAALLSQLPAQAKPDPVKLPEAAKQKQKLAIEMWRLAVQKPELLQPKVNRPRVLIRPWIRPSTTLRILPHNPLLTGGYKKAIDAFDRTRARLYTTRDRKKARQLLHQLERDLLDVRRELWKLEVAAKKKRAIQIFLTTQLVIGPQVTVWNPPQAQLIGWNLTKTGHLQVGNQWVLNNGTNPLLRGDYSRGINELRKTRIKIDKQRVPRLARKHLDQLMRDLLAARRGLWLAGQAQR